MNRFSYLSMSAGISMAWHFLYSAQFLIYSRLLLFRFNFACYANSQNTFCYRYCDKCHLVDKKKTEFPNIEKTIIITIKANIFFLFGCCSLCRKIKMRKESVNFQKKKNIVRLWPNPSHRSTLFKNKKRRRRRQVQHSVILREHDWFFSVSVRMELFIMYLAWFMNSVQQNPKNRWVLSLWWAWRIGRFESFAILAA